MKHDGAKKVVQRFIPKLHSNLRIAIHIHSELYGDRVSKVRESQFLMLISMPVNGQEDTLNSGKADILNHRPPVTVALVCPLQELKTLAGSVFLLEPASNFISIKRQVWPCDPGFRPVFIIDLRWLTTVYTVIFRFWAFFT